MEVEVNINSMSDDDFEPDFVIDAAKSAESQLIPLKSKHRYRKVHDEFVNWRTTNNIKKITENVMLAYFLELSRKFKPTSLWAHHSMLKCKLKLIENIDIGKYNKLTGFMKSKSIGYKPQKAKVFSDTEMKRFIFGAPDREFLDVKVVCIFGISGALRTDELARIEKKDIEKHGDTLLLVNIWETKTKVSRSFTIGGKFYAVVQQYAALRSPRTTDPRFFVNYRAGKCTVQPIGKNKFSKMPERIATFLKLSEPKRYTGHSFRRSSASLLANTDASVERLKSHGGWKNMQTAQGYVENSLNYKKRTGELITSTITSDTIYSSQGYKENVTDDSDIPLHELPDLFDVHVRLETSTQVKESTSNDQQCIEMQSDVGSGETGKTTVPLQELQNLFNFKSCNITFNMK